MFDPNELDAKIARSHINAEKVEEEAKALENKILENYEVKKDMLKTNYVKVTSLIKVFYPQELGGNLSTQVSYQ